MLTPCVLAALVRVVICLPSTEKLFKLLKRRYSGSQIRELNSTCKWRGRRISIEGRIAFLRSCLANSVVPREIYEKVKRVRPRFAASIGRAFVKNEIAGEQEKLEHVAGMVIKSLHQVRQFLSFFDWIRFSKMLGETGCRLRKKIHADNWNRLRWLRTKRFGSEELITTSVVNLSSMTLTQTQLEVLSRGPKFGIPPRAICKEEVLSEFEMYFTQVERALLDSEIPTSGYAEQLVRFRTR